MEKQILGHIDCPTCGTHAGMRITHDKNGQPFGYCEINCGQQLRIGGDVRRVRDFIGRFPWAASNAAVTASKPQTKPDKTAKKIPVTVTEPKAPVTEQTPAPKARSAFEDALSFLGGKK